MPFIRALGSAHFAGAAPGLDEAALGALEAAVGAEFPEPARAMYRQCGGMSDRVRTALPLRLLRPAEVVETRSLLADMADTYQPHAEARYLFSDDNSNWVGLFVEGPLRGKLSILDHDVSSAAPRFASVEHFLEKLVAAADAGRDWPQMQTDYPLSAASEAALVEDARPLSALFMALAREAMEPRARNVAVDIGLHLADPRSGDSVEKAFAGEAPFARQVALQIAAVHRRTEWAPALLTCGQAAIARNEYTVWSSALKALGALEVTAELEALVAAAPSTWPSPLRR